jgi:hypothetical protein
MKGGRISGGFLGNSPYEVLRPVIAAKNFSVDVPRPVHTDCATIPEKLRRIPRESLLLEISILSFLDNYRSSQL